jgi:DNA-binding response OmpR family regulator
VGIDSSPGRGAAFKIFLPQASEIAIAPVPDLNDRKSSMGSGTILLVEDEEALRDLTAEQLSDSGFKVLSARDGIHALDVARSYDDTIHLLLTDVMMPKLGGPALARYISHLRPETRILFMTGHAELDAVVQGGLPEGAESLQKPFARDTLLKRVRQLIDTVQVPVSN